MKGRLQVLGLLLPSARRSELAQSSGGNTGEERVEALEDFAARIAVPGHDSLLDAAAAELVAHLDRARVPVLLLKGPALARLLYRPDELRRYHDLDVLVAPGDRERARVALAELDYENISERGVDDFLGILHAETWYRRRPDGALVDLHWRLAGCAAAPEEVWARLYEGRGTIELAGRRLAVPGRPALALHLATHAAQHGPGDLRARGDLARGLERWSLEDWQAAAQLAAALGGTAAFAAGLRLLPKGAELAQALALPETEQLSWEILHRDIRPRGTFHLEALVQARGVRQRADVLRRSLLPTPEWIVWSYRWAAGSRVRLLGGYARHLSRSPGWAVRAWRFRRRARNARPGSTGRGTGPN